MRPYRVALVLLAAALAVVLSGGVGVELWQSEHFLVGHGAVVRAQSAAGLARPVGDWPVEAMDLEPAWKATRGNASTLVAVVDTGVDPSDPALTGPVVAGYDFVHNDTETNDDNGHGTAVAGIIASVCPKCSILPVKVLDANRTGDAATIAAGIIWAVDHGASVINLSVGAPRAPQALADAVAYALSKDVPVVAAAGNDGRDESFYPAMYPGVVSVVAVDANDSLYPWSNFGGWATVAAPGCVAATWTGGGYVSDFCGTSTAAAFVSGLAGLALSLAPRLGPARFAALLSDSTTPLPETAASAAGVPDADRMLAEVSAASSTMRNPGSLRPGRNGAPPGRRTPLPG